MTWKLWLDDLCRDSSTDRFTPEGFIGCTSPDEAIAMVSGMGIPEFMSLDHDLGENLTTMDFLKEWSKLYPYAPFPDYRVHSSNPVGKKNIESYINSWNRSLK